MPKSRARPQRELRAAELKRAMFRRLPRRTHGSGEIVFPAVPALLDEYVRRLETIFAQYGRVFSKDELDHLRTLLRKQLEDGFAQSPYAKILVKFETTDPPATSLSYRLATGILTTEDQYEYWVRTRTPPLFGAHPDAKVMDLAHSLGAPQTVPVLDMGAGTGRNTVPLAQAGFPTDAIELAPALAAILRDAIAEAELPVRVFEGDAVAGDLDLPQNHYKLAVLAEVVTTHIRDVKECRDLFQVAADALAPGGVLLFSVFLAMDGLRPDTVMRQLSEVFWCTVFTREDMADAVAGLPFELVSDEPAYSYEKEHLPEGAWPPTGWFEEWAQGLDLFALPAGSAPIQMYWRAYRKTS